MPLGAPGGAGAGGMQIPRGAIQLPPGASLPPGAKPIVLAPGQGPPPGAVLLAPGVNPMVAHQQRQAKRLYVGNVALGTMEDELLAFIKSKVESVGVPAESVVSCNIPNANGNFAFIELSSAEEATQAMSLEGTAFKGDFLRMRRPKDYVAPPGAAPPPEPVHVPGVVSNIVRDGPNKIFIGGLPNYLTDDQVKELLSAFGELRAFNLVRDNTTGLGKGYGFCEYLDTAVTDQACQGLNGMELGERKLTVQRAHIAQNPANIAAAAHQPGALIGGAPNLPPVATGANMGPLGQPGGMPGRPPMPGGGGAPMLAATNATQILVLLNMVSPEELEDDEEYVEITEDVRDECSKFGSVLSLAIPRPIKGKEVSAVGKIFVEFATPLDAQKAHQALAGRKFDGRTVVTSFYSLDQYKAGDFF